MKPHESDMTREGEAAYRAVERNIGAAYLERAARELEAMREIEQRRAVGYPISSDTWNEVQGAQRALNKAAQRIRALKEE